MECILTILILAIFILLLDKIKTIKEPEQKTPPEQKKLQSLDTKYKKTQLLTKAEYVFYNALKQKCDENNLLICPKVRLEDFIQVTAQEKNKYRGYIKSRHVDFLICDKKLHILCALELDDTSHNTQKAKATDNFKNELYKTINLPLYRIKTIDNYNDKITEMINNLLQSNNKKDSE